ncbi:hypothetical protein NEUTE1DRAFT_35762 [Neurospora tetrasperma FGSC 2508]|uniref:Uncharacterized protein n=1 Tax=Neurospora tetrasperma (strain FGSC 2508 / ATCC MYA-4615 / P0657) TaxID=510951 RepID=F8MBX5_NEUT8|nr:uncharacterized protein NEUTE1DRAFT_35762 [Neurospora tetrasperma FGSC 2508]EGO61184.1 hypothetical protein NEUTE1DRAFT_35762 [Neurospora tetrasperma FGSC 2508]EGZ74810.1 hypothetical protein NEUTE2DRAFT_58806 [Neurospora tetrasperma FGSC 2509]
MHTISSVTGWVLRDTGIGLLMIVVNLESRLRVKATKISGITGCNRERAAGGEMSSDKGQQYHCIYQLCLGISAHAVLSSSLSPRPKRVRAWAHQQVETVKSNLFVNPFFCPRQALRVRTVGYSCTT